MAAAIRELKKNKILLATVAKKFFVSRNTLRTRVLTAIVSKRGTLLDTAIEKEIVDHLLMRDSKEFSFKVNHVRVSF